MQRVHVFDKGRTTCTTTVLDLTDNYVTKTIYISKHLVIPIPFQ